MRFLIHWLLVVFTVLNPMFANAALTDYDRQELAFDNLLGKFNGGFESGKANWTASGGTFTAVTSGTNLLVGKGSFTWDASASAQTLTSQAVTIPEGYHGLDCEANILVQTPSGTATHFVEAYDGSNVIARINLVTSTTPRLHPVNFVCPQSGTVAVRIYANADEPLIAGDVGYIGRARNVGSAQQAIHKGSIRMTGCTDWSRSSTSFGNFTATSGCSYTVTGDVLSPSTFIPGFRLQNVGPGRYLIFARGSWWKTVTTTNADIYLRMSDGTNTFGEQAVEGGASSSGQSAQSSSHFSAAITYTTAQATTTFQLQGLTSNTTSSTAIQISDDGGPGLSSAYTEGLQFDVYYFPSQAQSLVSVQNQGWFVDATIAGANPSLGVAAVTSYTEITSASLTMLPRTGSAPVGIMCSSTNAATAPSTGNTTCAAGSESLGANFDIPTIGAYKVCAYFSHFIQLDTSESVNSAFQLIETPTNAQTETAQGGTRILSAFTAGSATSTNQAATYPHSNCSIFNFTSIGTKGVRLMYEQSVTGTPNNSLILADQDTSTGQRDMRITVERMTGGVDAILTNSVSTKNQSGKKLESAVVACSSSSSKTDPDSIISSVGNISSGTCSLTLTSGIFASAPLCFVTLVNGAVSDTKVNCQTTSSTAATVSCYGNGANCTSFSVNLLLYNPR